MPNFSSIIGKKIKKIQMEEYEHCMILYTEDEASPFVFITDSDCCSETWFADIIGVENSIGGTVLDIVNTNPAHCDDGRCRQESDMFYGFQIRTDKGHTDIIFRNSSNGFYGGSVFLQRAIPEKMSFYGITKDWEA